MLLAVMIVTTLPVTTAKAKSQVDLSIDLPLGGIMKYSQWTQIVVTVDNHGEAFDGQIEVGEKESSIHGMAVLSKPFKIGSNETKQVALTIPGESLQQMSPAILRVKSEGKVVGKKALPFFRFTDSNVIAVVDSSSNTFHFLTGASIDESQRQRYAVERLKPEMLPDESWLYKNVDVLAIGNLPPDSISDSQVAAVREWVKRGGVLILFAGEKGSGLIPSFVTDLNLGRLEGAPSIQNNLDEIRALSGKTLLPSDTLPVFDRGKPLFISKKSGEGLLLFTNYDIGAEPFASWQYNRDLWRSIFTKYNVLERIETSNSQYAVDSSMLRLSQFIPDVRTPRVGMIIVIWSIYLIIVAPGLYWALKKLDRREWAWGIIPVSALVLTLGVYLVGRPSIVQADTAYHVNKVSIKDDTLSEVQTASSFLTVSGGSFAIQSLSSFQTVPIGAHHSGGFAASGFIDTNKTREPEIRYDHVPYLSIRQATAMGVKTDIGSFLSKLSIEQNRLQGTVQNNTAYPMDELYIQLGHQRIPLGAVKQGETKQVDTLLENNFLSKIEVPSAKARKQRTEEEQTRELKESITYAPGLGIHLVGINHSPIPVIELEKPHRAHYWNTFVEKIKLLPSSSGRIIYPYGTLPIDETKDVGDVTYRDGLWILEKGSITFTLAVNRAPFQPSKVEIPLDQSVYRPFKKEIYRVKSGKWEQIDNEKPLSLEKNLKEYLTTDGKLMIRFSNDDNAPLSMPEPFFQVEGVEQR